MYRPPPILHRLGLFVVGLLVLLSMAAPRDANAQSRRPPHPVRLTAAFEPPTAPPGATVTLVLSVAVDPRYHIYSMVGVEGEGPLPSTPDATVPDALQPAGPWKEPFPREKFDKGFEILIGVHEGENLRFTRPYRIADSATSQTLSVPVTFNHMACLDTSCLPPRLLKATAELAISPNAPAPPPVATPAAEPTKAAAPAPVTPSPTPQAATASATEPKQPAAPATTFVSSESQALASSGLVFILACFLAGVVSLATPCVFPMIPITISFFTKRAGKTRGESIKLATIYSLTIVLAFTFFGFGVAAVLWMLGSGVEGSGVIQQVAANPWVNIALAAVFVAFALSLFGLFDLELPSGIANRLQQAKGSRADAVGAILMALIFVIVSFTCTGPIVGLLIVNAVAGDWTRPLFGMLAYAVGFAAPFFFLALAPSALASLPKSGGWLNSTKVVMGFLELAAALKFISNADLVWQWQIFSRELLLAAWVAISAAIVLYLIGRIRFEADTPVETIGVGRLFLVLGFGTLSLFLAHGLFGGRLPGWFEAYMPPETSTTASVASAAATGRALNPITDLSWHKEVAPALAEATATGRPVFVDFTGYTCTNCRLMEKNVFPDPQVAPLFERFVRVKLFTDDAKDGERHQEYQAERFGTVALPTYALLRPDGSIVGVTGYTPDAATFAAFMRQAL